ncbi:MAG: CNNM domain-containing protein [Pseudomonadota bacterium]|nr:CNNM domain-containing protein [Pseudomonadota bacterium]
MSSLSIESLFVILVILLILSAFFSGSETALMSVNKYKLKHRVKNNEPSAIRVDYLLTNTDKTLGLILLLNNFVNILASAITTLIAIELYGDKGIAIAAGILTFLILVFSEVTPKTFASHHADKIAYNISFVFYYSLVFFSPVVLFINFFSKVILKVFKVNKKNIGSDNLSNEEIKTIIKESSSKITENYEEMVLNLLDLQKVTVENAMIPKNDVEGIDIDDTPDNINKKLISINHTRMPIYSKSLNNVKGFFNKKHIPSMIENFTNINKESLLTFSNEPYFIPEDTSLLSQLITFKKEKKRIGCVVDEYGETKGILTLDDILEEIVGEYSSLDQKNQLITDISHNKIEVHGSIQLRDINKRLGVNLPDSNVTTINGYILETLQEIPQPGMTFKEDKIIIEVMNVSNNFVEKAVITYKND